MHGREGTLRPMEMQKRKKLKYETNIRKIVQPGSSIATDGEV